MFFGEWGAWKDFRLKQMGDTTENVHRKGDNASQKSSNPHFKGINFPSVLLTIGFLVGQIWCGGPRRALPWQHAQPKLRVTYTVVAGCWAHN